MIGVRPNQILELQCACCRQPYHPATAAQDALEARIFGTDKYVQCAICEQTVPEELRDNFYEERWRRAIKGHLQKEEFRLLVSLSILIGVKSFAETDSLFDLILRKLQVYYPDKSLPELIESGNRLHAFLLR